MHQRTITILTFSVAAAIAVIGLGVLNGLQWSFVGIASICAIPVAAGLAAITPLTWFSRPGCWGAFQSIAGFAAIAIATAFIAGSFTELTGIFQVVWASGTLFTMVLLLLPPLNLTWIIGGIVLWYVHQRLT